MIRKEFLPGAKVMILPKESAISQMDKKMKLLKKQESKNRLQGVRQAINGDYTDPHMLSKKEGDIFTVIKKQYGKSNGVKGLEAYYLDGDFGYSVFGFCLKEVTEYAVILL